MPGSTSSVSQSNASIAPSVIDANAEREAATREVRLNSVDPSAFSKFARSEWAAGANIGRCYISKRTGEIEVSSNVFSHFIRKLSGNIVGLEALQLSVERQYGKDAIEMLRKQIQAEEGRLEWSDIDEFLENFVANGVPEVQPWDEEDEARIWENRTPQESVVETEADDPYARLKEHINRRNADRDRIDSQNHEKFQALIQNLPADAKQTLADWQSAAKDCENKYSSYLKLGSGEVREMEIKLNAAKRALERAERLEPKFKAEMATWLRGIESLAKDRNRSLAVEIMQAHKSGAHERVMEEFVKIYRFEIFKDNIPSRQTRLKADIARLESQVKKSQTEIRDAYRAYREADKDAHEILMRMGEPMSNVLRTIDWYYGGSERLPSAKGLQDLAENAKAAGLDFSPEIPPNEVD